MADSPAKIPGGYIILARKMLGSGMMDAPPLRWKLWVWMLGRANWRDRGKLARGQFVATVDEMREAMGYKVGGRVERPTYEQVRSAYLAFAQDGMISYAKTTRGLIVTITNYDKYQDPGNYETQTAENGKLLESCENSSEAHSKPTPKPTPNPTRNNKVSCCDDCLIGSNVGSEAHTETHAEDHTRYRRK